MVVNMKVIGIKDKDMEWVYKLTQMVINMKVVDSCMKGKTDKVYLMVINIKVFITRINVMEKGL